MGLEAIYIEIVTLPETSFVGSIKFLAQDSYLSKQGGGGLLVIPLIDKNFHGNEMKQAREEFTAGNRSEAILKTSVKAKTS